MHNRIDHSSMIRPDENDQLSHSRRKLVSKINIKKLLMKNLHHYNCLREERPIIELFFIMEL